MRDIIIFFQALHFVVIVFAVWHFLSRVEVVCLVP
jgi:hypothetical protein